MSRPTPIAPEVQIASWGDRVFYTAVVASTLFHLSVIVASNSWSTTPGLPQEGQAVVDSRWNTDETNTDSAKFESIAPLAQPTVESLPNNAAYSPTTLLLDESPLEKSRPTISTTQADPLADWIAERSTAGDLSRVVGPVTSGGSGSGTSNGGGGGGKFFETETEGRRFVFVVDRSKSMNYPYPGEYRTRFGRLKIEMARSITQMDEGAEFFIIFFNDEAYPMPTTGFQQPNEQVRSRTFEWLASVPADGQTDPRPALQMALKLRPDVIYFLTDGDFPKYIAYDLTKLEQRDIVIHTFSLGNPEGETTLKKVAERNRGKYTFIP